MMTFQKEHQHASLPNIAASHRKHSEHPRGLTIEKSGGLGEPGPPKPVIH